MLAVMLLLLLLLPEVGRKLLHVLVADGALLLLLLALSEKLLQLRVHLLLLLGLGRLLVVVWRLLLLLGWLMRAKDGVAAAALLLLELLHLLLELQVRGEGHLSQRGRVGRLLLLLLLLWRLRGVVSSFQNGPSLRLGHLRHLLLLLLLLTRVRLLQIPRNVTARHARLLLLTMVAPARSHLRHSNRIRMVAHSRVLLLLLVDNRRSLLLLRRMLAHKGAQISLGEGRVAGQAEVSEDVLVDDATRFFAVGGRSCVADGRSQLFIFLFGSHLAQHRSRREGERSRGGSVLMLMVLRMLGLVR